MFLEKGSSSKWVGINCFFIFHFWYIFSHSFYMYNWPTFKYEVCNSSWNPKIELNGSHYFRFRFHRFSLMVYNLQDLHFAQSARFLSLESSCGPVAKALWGLLLWRGKWEWKFMQFLVQSLNSQRRGRPQKVKHFKDPSLNERQITELESHWGIVSFFLSFKLMHLHMYVLLDLDTHLIFLTMPPISF